MTESVEQIKLDSWVRTQLGEQWIPQIYQEKIRPLRTRSFELGVSQHENETEIQHTLLGIELKAGKARLSCPDLATARYLNVFARIGCQKIAVPYDITAISGLADELETAWHRMLLLFERKTKMLSPQLRGKRRAALIRLIRDELDKIGAGELMPLFNTSTKQRES